MNEAQARGRRMLILISLMFATPIVVAMYMYFAGVSWQPTGSTEYGTLVNPPRPLPETQLSAADEQFLKIWSLVVLADADCDAECLTALSDIRQVRLSLGPKMTRFQTVFLPASETAVVPQLAAEHPKLIVVDPAASAEIRAIIGEYANGEVFMVDPLGNVMMRYAPGTDKGDIRKDIAHLLKLSGIG